ncbi:MAG: choice-of-anchor J domain-containing protein [Bacteroidales bacterium]
MKKITLFSLFLMSFVCVFAQTRYLNESFNKIISDRDFPPYGWLNVDGDGDGFRWRVSADGDGYNGTTGAVSDSWQMQDLKPQNWLITPRLEVEKITDSIKFMIASFEEDYENSTYPESYALYVSTKTPAISDFTELIDSMTFVPTQGGWQSKALSLKKYVGQKIYIGFLHNTTRSGLVLRLDNIMGPKICEYEKELGILSHLNPPTEGCEVQNMAATVVLQNLGTLPLSNIPIHTQIATGEGDVLTLGLRIDDTIHREIPVGDTIHFTFSKASAYGDYFGTIMTRTWFTFPTDEYHANDTAYVITTTQTHVPFPLMTSFETTEQMKNWTVVKDYAEGIFNFGWGISSNTAWARTGDNYGVFACEYNAGSMPYDGTNDYLATPCLYLEKGTKYKVNFYYKFRLNDTCSFRLLIGKDAHTLHKNGSVIVDRMVFKDRDGYKLFSSPAFEVQESGTYYVGTMAHHIPVASEADYWMIFLDDWTLSTQSDLAMADLGIDNVEIPFDCNLTDAEEIKITYSNQADLPVSNFEIVYQIKNRSAVVETIADTIYPTEQKTYTFKTKADFSALGIYEILGRLNCAEDMNEDNNVKTVFLESQASRKTPFLDDFESYATLESFENTWKMKNTFPVTGFVLSDDYTDTRDYAYSGKSFLAHVQAINSMATNDWAVSPCIELIADTVYRVSFFYRVFKPSTVKHSLKVSLLSGYEPSSYIKEIIKRDNIQDIKYTWARASLKVDRTQVYHIGFQVENGAHGSDIFIEDLRVEKASTISNEKMDAKNWVSIYPNPVKENLNVLTNAQIHSVELFNLLGASIYRKEGLATDYFNIPLKGIQSGMYILKINTNQGQETKKVMIK